MILTPEQLQDLGMAVFREAGVPEESAASVVEALVRAELDGLPSHGFSRIPFYVDQALSGKVKARAIPLVRQAAPAAVLVDAGNGFAFPAILAGLEKAIPLARRNGVSVLGVTRSHHCGVVGLYAERIAEAGLISLIFSNTPGGDGSVERIKGVLWDESASLWLSEGGEASAGDRYVPEQSGAGQDHGRETAG